MTVRVPALGQRIFLEAAVGKRPQEELDLRLFWNVIVDLGSLSEADFAEVRARGYARKLLRAEAWDEEPNSRPLAYVYREPQTFAFEEAAGDVRGYYLTQRSSGRLVWYESFAQAVNSKRRGDRITVVPRLVATSA